MNTSRVFSLRFGTDVRFGECTNNCAYCFAHNNFRNAGKFGAVSKAEKRDSIVAIANAINRGYIETMKSYWIENRYPVCVSNHSDFCANPDREYCHEVISMLKSAGFPIYIETKGTADKTEIDFLLKQLDPRTDVIYCTVEFPPNNDLSSQISNSPSIKDRINFIGEFQAAGFFVEVGINPLIRCMIDEEDAMKIIDATRHDKTCYVAQALHFAPQIWKKTPFFKVDVDFEKIIDHCENVGAVIGIAGYHSKRAFDHRIKQKNFSKPMINPKICGTDFSEVAIEGYEKCCKRDGEGGIDDGRVWYGVVYPDRMVELLDEKKPIPDFLVDRKEIYSRDGNYFNYGLPEKFSYRRYLKLCVEKAFEVARSSYLIHFTDSITNETGLVYPFQKINQEACDAD